MSPRSRIAGMAPENLTVLGGPLMGLSSSLHCAGACGDTASSLIFAVAGISVSPLSPRCDFSVVVDSAV
jgi:hypothetical protein